MPPTRLSDIRHDHEKAGAMHELLAPCAFADPYTVLTKRQDLFSVMRLSGVDAECLDPEHLGHVTQRFETSLRVLGPEYRVYQYLLKRNSPDLPAPEASYPLAERRSQWLERRSADLYSIELYLVVLRERSLQDRAVTRFLKRFSASESLRVIRTELRRETELLANAV
jgi:type IV secretory pathway VirB4 component